MPVVRHADPAAFLAAARPVAARDEAEAMMLEARVRALADAAKPGPRAYLATYARARTRGAAFFTDSHPVSLGASDAGAGPAFADDLAADHPDLRGVYGRLAPCERFYERWRALTGRVPRLRFHMRHHVLHELLPVPSPRGAPRVARPRDLRWLVACHRAFVAEVGLPDANADWTPRVERGIVQGHYWIWSDRRAQAFAGWTPATTTSVRVAPVYTVPEARGRGCATALVAAMSRALREAGIERLSLTTDLANPVSNAIYARIGYRPTSDAYHFDLLDPAKA